MTVTEPPRLPPAQRTYPAFVETRLQLRQEPESEGDGRTLFGLAVPFDTELDIWGWWDDYTELFRRGSFAKTITDRKHPVKLLVHHERRGLGIGVATELEEREDGLHAAFQVARTPKGDEVLELVRIGAISGLSIGFEPVAGGTVLTEGRHRTPPAALDLHERTEVILHEVSVCNFPAYEDAGVHGVRQAQGRHPSLAALAAERARSQELTGGWEARFNRVRR